MAYSAWQQFVQNDAGDVLPSASIEVRDEATGSLAILYSTAGGAALGNPFTAGIDGLARFYVGAGQYKITATSGTDTATYRFYPIGNAQSCDTGITDGNLILAEEAISRIVTEATASRTLTIADRNKHIRFTSGATAVSVTFPAGVFSANDQGSFFFTGAGTLSILAASSSVIINGIGTDVTVQYGRVDWKCAASNVFDISGGLV